MSDRFYPSVLRLLTLVVTFSLLVFKTNAQSNPGQYYLITDKTYSNRTTDNVNDGNVANKTWTFADFTTSWDSRYYKGDITKPAYTEGYLAQYSSFDFRMNYRLLFPVGYNAPENSNYKWPLIIMMHGLGESGTGAATSKDFLNNDKNVVNGGEAHLNAVYLANGKKAEDPTVLTKSFPGLVLFPQQAAGQWFYKSQTDAATALLERIIATYNVDPDRIYIHGLSNGGAATWNMIRTKPQLYAGALPMSATSSFADTLFNVEINKLVPIPSWIFQGGLDTSPSPNNTNQIVAKLKAAGASVRYTIYPNIGHGTWGTAYSEPEFFSWMLTKNKSDISVLYQNPTICPTLTTGGGAKLAVGTGFLAYQWEKDGVIVSGENSNVYTATLPGTYRARYSRISASPVEAEWNKWSKSVVITESSPVSTSIATTSSPHLPDININYPAFTTDSGSTKWYSVGIQAPTTSDTYKDWYYNYNNSSTLQSDTSSTIVRSINHYNVGNTNWSGMAGTYTLQTRTLSGCPSLVSNPIYITTGTTSGMTAPTNFQAKVTSSGSVQLFWTDNANNETGYEIQRAAAANGPYTFYKLVGEDIVSYNDTGLTPNASYYYRIRAVNNSDTSPYNSPDLVVAMSDDTTPPTAPQNLSKVSNTIGSVILTWTASTDNSSVQKYIIYYSGGSIDTGSNNNSFNVTGLTANTNYTFTVKAVDNKGNISQPSNQLLTSTVFSGLDYEHTPDNVGDATTHSVINSLYGIRWGYHEYSGHLDNFSIAPRVQDNYFNFKFSGYITPPATASYYFRVSANDAANLYLGTSTYANTAAAFTYPSARSSWAAINSGLTNTNVRSVLISSGTTVFAATAGGVFKSANNGTSWSALNTGLTNTDVKWLALSSGTIFAATAGGIFSISTSGNTWTQVGLVSSGLTNVDVRHIAVGSSSIYASTAGGVFVSSSLTGTSWSAMNGSLTNTDVRYIAINGASIYAATAGGVFLSASGGSWSAKNNSPLNTNVRTIAINSGNLFAGTAAGVFLSKDGGTTWTAINTGLSNTSVLSLYPISNNGVNNIFAGTDGGAYMYSYDGTNWSAESIGLSSNSVKAFTANNGSFITATPNGAFYSMNSGANWASVNRIVANNTVPNLNTCATVSTGSTSSYLEATKFYPISIIYYDLVDDECLTVEYSTDNATWFTVPDSWFKTGTTPVPTATVVPGSLVATAQGMTSIGLTWTHATATDDFEIYRSTDNVNYTIVSTVTTNGVTSFTDTGLVPAQLYYYKIRSINATGGSSAFTSPVSATTDPDSQAPTVPQNVTVLTNTYTNAGLSWDASTDNVALAGYKIFANGNLLGTSSTTTYFTTALLPATAYSFTVKAYDLNGNESAFSTAANITTTAPATFYSKDSPADLSVVSSWGMVNDGTGTAPANFSVNGQQFVVRATNTLSNPLTIGGGVSSLKVNSGVTLDLQTKITGKINVDGTVNVNYDGGTSFGYDFETMSPTSTVVFNTYSSIPLANYGNLKLNGTGIKTFVQGTFGVQGNLDVANGIELKGTAGNSSIIKVKGNLTLGTVTTPTLPQDNLVAIQFTGDDHNFGFGGDLRFYKIAADDNGKVNLINGSGSSKNILLGSLNGGGLELGTGSTFYLADNTLSLTGASSINTANTAGRLSVTGGSIQLTTTSSSPSNLYFTAGSNKVKNFTLQSSGGGLTTIREPLEIYDGIKINAGTLSSSGNITLKSSAAASASIRQIVGGSVTGNVVVERYLQPKGEMYRYMSSSIVGATVANWQQYIPVTGPFTNSTNASYASSMFTYAEPDYAPFPLSSNTEQFQVGKGYAVYAYDTTAATLITTGVVNQGTINFTGLTGGTGSGATDGYNLLGNPYPSDVVWSNANTGWTLSGISNVISVSENLANGTLQWRVWDRSSNIGTLENGKIPAGQAFWVQTINASPSLSINEAAKTAEPAANNTEYYRTTSRDASTRSFSIELNNGTDQDLAFVSFTEDGTDAFSKLNDGAKRQNSFFNLSTGSSDGITLSMNNLSMEFCEKIIPVNIENAVAGSYHLKFNNIDQFVMSTMALQDKYLGTEQQINAGNNDFIVSINGDAASAQNRFFLKLSRPDVATDIAAVSDKKNFCSSEEMVTVTISDSQPEVDYTAFLGASSVGVKQTGTGDAIQLQVPVSALAANQNTISIQASFPGCAVKTLDKIVTVNKTVIPTITGSDDYYGCVGSAMDIKVNSSSTVTYQWLDIKNDKTLSETSGTISIAALADANYYSVTAVDANGCKSLSKSILVRSDTLDVPVVVLKDDVLSVTSKGDVQWLLDGEIIPDAILLSYTPTASGNYAVRAENNYCTKESEPVAYIVTGLNEPTNGALSLRLYPNPSERGEVTVTGQSNSTSAVQIQFLDLTGRQLINRGASYEEYAKGVSVKGELSAGAYIVRVIQDGTIRFKKLVVH